MVYALWETVLLWQRGTSDQATAAAAKMITREEVGDDDRQLTPNNERGYRMPYVTWVQRAASSKVDVRRTMKAATSTRRDATQRTTRHADGPSAAHQFYDDNDDQQQRRQWTLSTPVQRRRTGVDQLHTAGGKLDVTQGFTAVVGLFGRSREPDLLASCLPSKVRCI